MNLEQIKTALANWSNESYKVIYDKKSDEYDNGHIIGLTWTDGTTLNGKEEDFYVK